MSKNDIRKMILEARGRMAVCEQADKSSTICRKLLESDIMDKASLVMCYMDFRNEVRTGGFIRDCFDCGKRVALPVVRNIDGGKLLVPYEVKDIERDLCEGAYGILEPVLGIAKPVDEQDIDIVVVPGVAFDQRNYRLGYGAGYYDRFLRLLKPSCPKVGIAFEIQMVDEIPVEAHDIAMDLVITESRILGAVEI